MKIDKSKITIESYLIQARTMKILSISILVTLFLFQLRLFLSINWILLVCVIIVSIFLFLYPIIKLKRAQVEIKKEGKFKNIQGELLEKFKGIENEINNYYSNNKQIEYVLNIDGKGMNASVFKEHAKINIIVTLGFIKSLLCNEKEIKPLLFHEFGHIFYDDWGLYVYLNEYFKIYFVYYVGLILLLFFSAFSGNARALILLISTINIFCSAVLVRNIRYSCEARADYFAGKHLGKNEFIAYLESLKNATEKKEINNFFLPTVIHRIKIIERFL
jgi:Zn-dependent protease with chaperone function